MPLFQRGAKVGAGQDQDRWLVIKKLGEGQFAEVYEIKDNQSKDDKRYALKIEKRRDVKSVKQEYKVLKRYQERGASLICSVYGFGSHEDRFYMIMELLGNNVAEARKAVGGRFDMATVKRLAFGTLQALEEVHVGGFVHRDVKPANFAVSPHFSDPLTGIWKVIDFGLARRYMDEASGELLPERTDTSFRGSTPYASIYAHQEQDLGRRDDLWSWLYCLVELLEGTLPWRADKDKEESRDAVFQVKQACLQDPSRYFRNSAPLPPVLSISNYLATLGFADAPSYQQLYMWLAQLPDDMQSMQASASGASAANAAMMGAAMMGMGGWGGPLPQQQAQQQMNAMMGGMAQMAGHMAQADMMLQGMMFSPQFYAPGAFGSGWPPPMGQGWDHMMAMGNMALQQQQQVQQAQQMRYIQQQQQQPQHPQCIADGPRSPPLDTPASPPESAHQQQQHSMPPPDMPQGGAAAAAAASMGAPSAAAQLRQAIFSGPPLAELLPDQADQLLAEALGEGGMGGGGGGPPEAAAAREAGQVAGVQEYVQAFKQGGLADGAQDAVGRLMALEPLEALAAIATVMDALASYAEAPTCNAVAAALASVSAYSKDAARRAMVRYCRAVAGQHQAQQAAARQ